MVDAEESFSHSDTDTDIVRILANSYAKDWDTDILLFTGDITGDILTLEKIVNRIRRSNILLILCTPGGDPNGAYRLARTIQRHYEKFKVLVSGYCKSAGTLVAIGAHELIFSEYGELGPLDIQKAKKDDLGGMESGLNIVSALQTLEDKAYNAFDNYLKKNLTISRAITFKTSAEIATNLTNGIFNPLYAQIDPLNIGETWREISIARHYGQRLAKQGQNIDNNAIDNLILQYPTHGFVIDQAEASMLFKKVRTVTPPEQALLNAIGQFTIIPASSIGYNIMEYLSDEPAEPNDERASDSTEEFSDGDRLQRTDQKARKSL